MRTRKFDPAEFIDNPKHIAGYLASAFEDGDADDVRDALAVVARSHGMAKLAKAAKLNEKSLYRTLGKNGNPEFTTVMRLLQALGVQLKVLPSPAQRKAALQRKAA